VSTDCDDKGRTLGVVPRTQVAGIIMKDGKICDPIRHAGR
jgi:hypothetical protein